jgi:hypothetical protein
MLATSRSLTTRRSWATLAACIPLRSAGASGGRCCTRRTAEVHSRRGECVYASTPHSLRPLTTFTRQGPFFSLSRPRAASLRGHGRESDLRPITRPSMQVGSDTPVSAAVTTEGGGICTSWSAIRSVRNRPAPRRGLPIRSVVQVGAGAATAAAAAAGVGGGGGFGRSGTGGTGRLERRSRARSGFESTPARAASWIAT